MANGKQLMAGVEVLLVYDSRPSMNAPTPKPSRLLAGLLAVGACASQTVQKGQIPEGQVYPEGSVFTGEWVGEVGEVAGTLRIDELEPGRYYGVFSADRGSVKYVLAINQLPRHAGGPFTSVATFTWQDGRGGRGGGWLMINREDTALTGAFGRDEELSGAGGWTFIRVA